MEYFQEKNGAYVYMARSQQRVRRILTLAMVLSSLTTLGVSVFLWSSMKGTGDAMEPMIPFVPLLVIPFTIATMLFVRGRITNSGSVRVDYVGARVCFGEIDSASVRRREVPTASVRSVTLASAGSGIYATTGLGVSSWKVAMDTDEGTFTLITLGDRSAAEGMASELAGLLSVPFRS